MQYDIDIAYSGAQRRAFVADRVDDEGHETGEEVQHQIHNGDRDRRVLEGDLRAGKLFGYLLFLYFESQICFPIRIKFLQ